MHPHNEHRDHKVQKSRVGHITRGYASGGSVHAEHKDEAQDKKLIRKMLSERDAQAVEGGSAKERSDKPRRAKGGKVKGKGATVNVIVGGQHPPMMAPHPGMVAPGAAPPPGPAPVPMPPTAAPPMAARPPMPMGGAPMPMGPHKTGGRAYAKGGKVGFGPAWQEGMDAATPIQHNPSGKNNQGDVGRGKPITYATGGAITSAAKGQMGPKLSGGGAGGEARLEKQARAARNYKRA